MAHSRTCQPTRNLLFIVLCLVCLIWSSIGRAASDVLLNVNFAANDRVKVGPAATGESPNDFWNNFTAPWLSYVVLPNLAAADGTPSGVALTVQNGPGQWGFDFPDLMYNCYIYSQDFGDVTLSVSNLASGAYDFYLYGHAAADNGNTVFQILVNGTDYGSQSTATNSDWSLTNWVEGAQYVVFRSVAVADPSVPVVIKAHPGLSGYVLVNGLQIQSAIPRAPWIARQPPNTSVVVGQDASLSVFALGAPPLAYQWAFNGKDIPGATGSSLVLTNVQFAQAGQYNVQVTNSLGSVTSTNAALTVTLPTPLIQLAGGTAMNGGSISLPITLAANGNENGLGFTLDYDTNLLQFTSIVLGSNAANATLVVNESRTNNGQVGVLLALPVNTAFGAGTQEVARVNFISAIVTNLTSTPLTFGDVPILRQLSDTLGGSLVAQFSGASVTLPPAQYEADVAPRPRGDGHVTLIDWVLIGRFVAGLDSPTNATEFQRSDCAPRQTRGDGLLTVADWVQAGRYAAGLDPLEVIGGPASPQVTPLSVKRSSRSVSSGAHQVRAVIPPLVPGQTCLIPVELLALGSENALGFSLSFDPGKLTFNAAALAASLTHGTLQINATAASAGRLGFALALSPGANFPAGTAHLLNLAFTVSAANVVPGEVVFSDQPVLRSLSDAQAAELEAEFVVVSPNQATLPALNIVRSQHSVTLSWPAWANGYVVQQAGSVGAGAVWSPLQANPSLSSTQAVLNLSPVPTNHFFRLYRP